MRGWDLIDGDDHSFPSDIDQTLGRAVAQIGIVGQRQRETQAPMGQVNSLTVLHTLGLAVTEHRRG